MEEKAKAGPDRILLCKDICIYLTCMKEAIKESRGKEEKRAKEGLSWVPHAVIHTCITIS